MTAAKPTLDQGSHWYLPDGKPFYEVPYADPSKGMRKATLADARKVGALPSVTTVLRVIHKENLVSWLIEQSCLTVLTAPRKDGEDLDTFVDRVLHKERQQDAEAAKARDLGTDVHAALEAAIQGKQVPDELRAYVEPVMAMVKPYGDILATEKVVVGPGYAGRVDLIQHNTESIFVWDFKTTKVCPRKSWPDHKIQLSGYANAIAQDALVPVKTGNIYLSTTEPGKFLIDEHDDWKATYQDAFLPALKLWQYLNDYKP